MLKSLIAKAVVCAAIATSFAPTVASAGTRETAAITVNVGDLDLTQPADRVRASRRVNSAIHSLCDGSGQRTITMRNAEAACRADALASVRSPGI